MKRSWLPSLMRTRPAGTVGSTRSWRVAVAGATSIAVGCAGSASAAGSSAGLVERLRAMGSSRDGGRQARVHARRGGRGHERLGETHRRQIEVGQIRRCDLDVMAGKECLHPAAFCR